MLPFWQTSRSSDANASAIMLSQERASGGVRRRTRRSPALPMPSCDLTNEYSGNQHECHLKRGGHAERVPQDARSRTEVCEHEPGEIQKNARCELPNGELQGIVAKPDGHENQADDTSPAQHLPRQHIGGIAPYEQERKRSSAMAYKNERDRICYQQNSCEPERHHGEMLGLSGIVFPPSRVAADDHDPSRRHNHLRSFQPTVVLAKMARPTRFELVTSAFGGQRSIQLSYGRA